MAGLQGLLPRDKHSLGVVRQGFSRGGESRPPTIALEEPHPKLPFQQADLLGQRWLGDEESLGGAGEMQFLGDGLEVSEIPEVYLHSRRLSEQVLDAGGHCHASWVYKPLAGRNRAAQEEPLCATAA